MAKMKKKTTTSKAPTLEELALEAERSYDPYFSRRKLDKPRYASLVKELRKFVDLRVAGKVGLSLKWFLKVAIPEINQSRAAHDQIPNDVAVGTILEWMEKRWPEERKAFKRGE